ncbi:MAG: hypothetical protein B6241_04845 [Spirochaetaceae bacterium 4572_59]|nr:MAG: hypothetical protein B6241_04845 [Spirochaetaceae bacterium 4572_59]
MGIKVGICCEHKLHLEGLFFLLDSMEGIEVLLKDCSPGNLLNYPGLDQIHILILNPHILDARILNITVQLTVLHPKLMVLILSADENETTILKTIKAGAKGFLAKDSDRNDLLEALYTLRNGHDYYSKSITQLLLKQYISDLKSESGFTRQEALNCLSSRELEVLTLWGNSNTNHEISEKLFISVRTVESHKNHIMQKLNLKTAVDMVKFAIKNNIIEV